MKKRLEWTYKDGVEFDSGLHLELGENYGEILEFGLLASILLEDREIYNIFKKGFGQMEIDHYFYQREVRGFSRDVVGSKKTPEFMVERELNMILNKCSTNF